MRHLSCLIWVISCMQACKAFTRGELIDFPYSLTPCPENTSSNPAVHGTLSDRKAVFCACQEKHYCVGGGCLHHTIGFDPACHDCSCVPLAQPPKSFHETLARYQALHDAIRRGLLPMHAAVSSVQGGGLADRLKAIYAIFYWCILTDRALFIQWDEPEPLEVTYLPAAIDWRLPSSLTLPEMHRFSNVEAVQEFISFLSQVKDSDSIVRLSTNNFPVAFLFRWRWDSSHLEGYHRTHGWGAAYNFSDPKPGLYQRRADELFLSQQTLLVQPASQFLFQPSEALTTAFKVFVRKNGHPSRYLGVHIRLGGQYNPNFKDPVRIEDGQIGDVLECAAQVAKNESLAASKWFITADSKHALQLAMDWMSEHGHSRQFISTENVVSSITHIARTHAGTDGGSSAEDIRDGNIRAFLDFWLLKHAAAVVGVVSGFNLLAAGEGGKTTVWRAPQCDQASLMF